MTDIITALRTYHIRPGETIHEGHPAHLMARAADEIERLRAKEAQYRARLEIDHYFVGDEATGDMKRVEVPLDDPMADSIPDGIECRDDTIKILEENCGDLSKRLRKAMAAFREIVECPPGTFATPEDQLRFDDAIARRFLGLPDQEPDHADR